MGWCCAPGCTNSTAKGHRMFVFPKKESRRIQWAQQVNRPGWTPTNGSQLCGDHFSDDQYEFWKDGSCTRLKRDAVPNIFHGTRIEIQETLQDAADPPPSPLPDNPRKRQASFEPNSVEPMGLGLGVESQGEPEAHSHALGGLALSVPAPEIGVPATGEGEPQPLAVGPSVAKKPRLLPMEKSGQGNLAPMAPDPNAIVVVGSEAPAQQKNQNMPFVLTNPPGLILLRQGQNESGAGGAGNVSQVLNVVLQPLVTDRVSDYQSLNSVLANDAVGSMFNLARVEMHDNWVLFIPRTFTVIFGQEKQPIPGVVLIVQKDTGRFYLTVFLKVVNSGILESAKEFHDLCRSAFGPGGKGWCTGFNDLNSNQRFHRTKFSEECTSLCENKYLQSSRRFDTCHQCFAVVQESEISEMTAPNACNSPCLREVVESDGSEAIVKCEGQEGEESDVQETVDDILASQAEILFEESIETEPVETLGSIRGSTPEKGKDCDDDTRLASDDPPQDASKDVKEELQTQERPADFRSPDADEAFDDVKTATRDRRDVDESPDELLDDLRTMWQEGACNLCDPPVPLQAKHRGKKLRIFSRHFVTVHKRDTVRCLMCSMEFKTRDGCLHRHNQYEHFKGVFRCSLGKCCTKKLAKRTYLFAQDYYKHVLHCHGEQGDSIKLTCPACTKEMDFPKDPVNEMEFPRHYQACVKLKYHNLSILSSNKKRKLLREGKLPESRTFTCEFCDMKFAHSDRLKRHRIVKHTKEYPFLCDQCPFGSTSKAELESHIKRHLFVDESSDHGASSGVMCDLCGLAFHDQKRLTSHRFNSHPVEHNTEKYGCNVCREGFEDPMALQHHMEQIHCQPDEKSEKCEFCPRLVAANCKFGLQHYLSHHDDLSGNTQYLTAMNSRFGLRVHKGTGKFIRHHSQGDPSAETIIPGKLPIGLKVTEVEQNVFACPFCEEKFDTRREANIHTRKVHADALMKCPECDYRGFRSNLFAHIYASHRGGKKKEKTPMDCEICGKTLAAKASYLSHMRQHNGEKPYKCPKCDMAYSSVTSMYTHYRIKHEGMPNPVSKARMRAKIKK